MEKMQQLEPVDVAIVGGGAAGCLAAIAAKEACPDGKVVILEKASVRRGGSIACGMDAINVVVIPGISNVEDLIRAQMSAAQGILDPSVVRAVGEESFAVLKDLESWGVEFPRNEKGQYRTFKQWSARDTGAAVTSIAMAGDLKAILDGEVERRGVRRIEHAPVTSVFTAKGRVAGLGALDIRKGEFLSIPACTVVLAAGSGARFGLPETGVLHAVFDCPACAGDSYSLGYRAGAHLVNMECVKHKITVRFFNGPGLAPLSLGGRLINAFGRPFLDEPSKESFELNNFMDLFSAILREYQEGRGPVYADTRHFSPEMVGELERCFFTTERPTFKKFFEARKVKIGRDPIEINLSEPVLCGGHGINGLKVNCRAETNVLGLYAAGDAAANGTSLMGAFVLGRIAGREAAKFAGKGEYPTPDWNEAEAEMDRVFAPLRRSEGIPPALLERKIRQTVNQYLDSPKSEPKLNTGQERLALLRGEVALLRAADLHGAMKAAEVQAILDCAEMVVAASLERKESRWGIYHHRVDYPQRNDEDWRKFVVVHRGASGQPALTTQPIGGG
ncbi:MAG: FAD-binding protein [Syntrophaceae bacterium]|nr:FAD-binding protein [Syntrophaceae bacterium]